MQQSRVKMRSEIAALHRRLGATMIYVTHDQVEAMTMADTIVVLRDDSVEQVGSLIDLYTRPRNRLVACFLGVPQMNILAARSEGAGSTGRWFAIDQGRARVEAPVSADGIGLDETFAIGVRPEHVTLDDGGLRARVEASEILGAETIIHAVLESGESIVTSVRGIHRVFAGDSMGFAIDQGSTHVFDSKGNPLAPAPHKAE